jgi:cell division protein FtsW (lipid II flippase)
MKTLFEIIVMIVVLYGLWSLFRAPVTIARARGAKNTDAICSLHSDIAWTIIGWAVCLIWALTDSEKAENKLVEQMEIPQNE